MENSSESNKYITDFKRRISEVKPTRWARFAVVSIIFFAWVAWLQNPLVALWIILLFDIYITGYIPLTWWKKSKNKTVKSLMSWVDAIVYAVVLVYFVFAFIGQNYQIPSSSLEKTLLTGDYLWVNKMVYGPRVPMTPVHFPLVHNTLPIVNCKSYLDNPAFDYHRLKGLRSVESGDIVVFNFPAGDTVSTRFEESPEYYDVLVRAYGRERVHSDKETFGDIIYRPVDRRQNFVNAALVCPENASRLSMTQFILMA
jgi:signal peptidase I